MVDGLDAAPAYFPPPESRGGWRWAPADDMRELTGIEPARLERVIERQYMLHGGDSWSLAIVRRGYLVREAHTFNVLAPTRFDIWSCTKSFTSTSFGLLIDDSRSGRLPGGGFDLDSPVYKRIPEGHPLSDPRKEAITAEHLLTMTSGIPGENAGVVGMPMATHLGSFEHALGFAPNRYGRWAKTLAGDPGSVWDYSDPAVAHLGLLFAQVAGRELADFFRERVGDPIGLESLAWDVQGGGGFLGPHTNAHTGVHLSARELVRFGYLLLRGGRWGARQLLQRWWIELATRTSQDLRPVYGYLWWVNSTGRQWPGLPTDAFAASGYRSNRCYVIPSLDLVVARVGSGPPTWDEPELIEGVVGAVVDTKAAESVPLVPDPGYSPVRQRAGHAERDVRVVPRT